MDKDISIKTVNINKSFGPTKAVTDLNFQLNKGEVHSVVGQNGAGKSTFIKILSGDIAKDSGQMYVYDKKVEFFNPNDARNLDIYTVYQELRVLPHLTVTENIFLNNYILEKKGPVKLIDWKGMDSKAKQYLKNWGLKIDSRELLGAYPLAIQQIIEILKNYILDPKVLILDEPTSALDHDEVKFLFGIIEKLKTNDVSIIFISHILEEVFEISDRITIFRDSKNVGTFRKDQINQKELVSLMVGEDIKKAFNLKEKEVGQEVVLKAEGLNRKGFFKDFDFELRKGEILGVVGVRGAGKSELAKSLSGVERFNKGTVYIDNKRVNIFSMADALKNGMSYVPEDRKQQGLFLGLPVIDNLSMTLLKKLVNFGLINERKRISVSNKYKELLNIKVQNLNQEALSLSGGNQQKLLIGRGLATQPRILIADEPTRGIDVGTKREIYEILNDIAKKGTSIIYFTDEPDEALGLCDRIIVIGRGKVIGEYLKGNINKKDLLLKMIEGGN